MSACHKEAARFMQVLEGEGEPLETLKPVRNCTTLDSRLILGISSKSIMRKKHEIT